MHFAPGTRMEFLNNFSIRSWRSKETRRKKSFNISSLSSSCPFCFMSMFSFSESDAQPMSAFLTFCSLFTCRLGLLHFSCSHSFTSLWLMQLVFVCWKFFLYFYCSHIFESFNFVLTKFSLQPFSVDQCLPNYALRHTYQRLSIALFLMSAQWIIT